MIPSDLRNRAQWVAWQLETRGDKPTKVPYGKGRIRASSTDPETWLTYESANYLREAHGYTGVGVVFTPQDPYVGVDLDDCVSRSGAINSAAYAVIRGLNGYVEFSPSGRGMHIIVKGHLRRGRKTVDTPWGGALEAYSSGRFFTFTGQGRGAPALAQSAINDMVARFFSASPSVAPRGRREPVCADDYELVDRVLSEPSMALLWRGDTSEHGGDRSAADLALCSHLAWLTGNDTSRMDSLFRASGLMRDKWVEKRGESSYGSLTIERALKR